jgi:hypothetical protein
MNYHSHTLRRPALFVFLYAALLGIEFEVTRTVAFHRQPDLMAGAILFDLVVVPAALLYWLILKPQARPASFLLLAVVAFLRLGLFVLPDHTRPFTLSWPVLVALVELGTFALAAVRIRSLVRAYRTRRAFQNPIVALQGTLPGIGPPTSRTSRCTCGLASGGKP